MDKKAILLRLNKLERMVERMHDHIDVEDADADDAIDAILNHIDELINAVSDG